MGIKKWIAKQGQKIADTTSKLSALSPKDIDDINQLRDKYFNRLTDLRENVANTALTEALLAAGSVEIFSAYLPQIKELYVPINSEKTIGENSPVSSIRYFNITKWVTDKKENSLEKMVNVYSVLSDENCNIALIFMRKVDRCEVYIAVADNADNEKNNSTICSYIQRIQDAIRGNFPGSKFGSACSGSPISVSEESTVAAVTNIPTESSEKFISQTIEKLLDGTVPSDSSKEYTIILLATPVRDIEERKLRLSELYSGFASYASWQTSYTYTETKAHGSSANFGVNAGVSAGIQNGQNNAVSQSEGNSDQESQQTGTNEGVSSGTNVQHTEGQTTNNTKAYNCTQSDGAQYNQGSNHTETHGDNSSTTSGSNETATLSGGAGISVCGIGANVGIANSTGNYSGSSFGTSSSYSDGTSVTFGNSHSLSEGTSVSTGQSQSLSESVGKSITNQITRSIINSLGRTVTKTVSNTAGLFNSVNFGGNFGANFARSSSVTATIGKNETIMQTFTNHSVKHALELIDEQMKRYEECTAIGMWDFAAYIISDDPNVANNVSHTYLSLTEGEKSYMSRPAVNIWRGDIGTESPESQKASEICKYLAILRHPVFGIDRQILERYADYSVYPPIVTATTTLSGKELALSLNFPQKSISGLPVIECAEFGRNVSSYDETKNDGKKLEIGNIYHMHHEEKQKVELSAKSLASHTFITGSTGSGKSNTVYTILDEAMRNDCKFMVIEPAKGEYKHVLGLRPDVSVYGTNPNITPLLKLDPFSFPADIHVLEHMDRLVEIFNVCWPMYAAMPAVLKNAIERSYEDCGWELSASRNEYDNRLFPTFADVVRNVRKIIDSSEYDSENKGAYKGSLITRLESLSNGINGMIFNSNQISDSKLFDQNVIVDLSRVGSTETKSLLMGILILKLQEYRMTSSKINADLNHITVLEEAHNILKRTSTEQNPEIGNLAGKSVEMLSNAIAEMRTYGEGFIIADQAPGLLDMSVIRNTNTKIIMRLPENEDRETAGKAAGMNEEQIAELAKLPCGVAAVYQNEWIQPVLCKVKKFSAPDAHYSMPASANEAQNAVMFARMRIASFLGAERPPEFKLKELDNAGLTSSAKVMLLQSQHYGNKIGEGVRSSIVCSLFPELVRKLNTFYSGYNDVTGIEQITRQYFERYRQDYTEYLNNMTGRPLGRTLLDSCYSEMIGLIVQSWNIENHIHFDSKTQTM